MAPEQAGRSDEVSYDLTLAEELCDKLWEVSYRMASHEEAFVTSLRERFEKYGSWTYLSQKQFDWLVELEAKYL